MVLCNGSILLCGGTNNSRKCLQLDHGIWKEHSTLNEPRVLHSAVTTQKATFLFGGRDSPYTYEYLPKDSTTWLMGKTRLPLINTTTLFFQYGHFDGCAIAVRSEQEILLIGGGHDINDRIIKFDVNKHTFQVWHSKLKVGRFAHRCAFIPNTNKVMITGGYTEVGSGVILDSTEILNTEDGSITMGSSMNSKRTRHGLDVVTINGEDRLAAFGGYNDRNHEVDCVEFYNTQTKKWEMTSIKMNEPKGWFGFLSIKLNLANQLLKF